MANDTARIRKLLGQNFFIGFEGYELPASVEKFIKDNGIGGVTLFANNYESPAQVAELVNHIQSLSPELPLVIAVDYEGGRVQRFKKPFTKIPEARVIGEQDSPKLAFECGELMARELKAVGVNVVFAPVADINTNVKNPVIGRRAYGETEEQVTKMVSAVVRGFLTGGVQCVVKHFPGHGDTSQDSHFHLPKVTTPLETLLEREFKPFTKAFKSRCQLVMTAHIIVEALEPKLPATLSKKIVQDLLRKELRFRGLIFTDDMEMKAIADHFGAADAPLMALEAGCDILLYHTEPAQTVAFEGLLSKLTSPAGAAALTSLEQSHQRLVEFKKETLLPYKPIYIPEISNVIGSPAHLAFAQTLDKLASGAKPA